MGGRTCTPAAATCLPSLLSCSTCVLHDVPAPGGQHAAGCTGMSAHLFFRSSHALPTPCACAVNACLLTGYQCCYCCCLPPAQAALKSFDDDHNGALDEREFERFAKSLMSTGAAGCCRTAHVKAATPCIAAAWLLRGLPASRHAFCVWELWCLSAPSAVAAVMRCATHPHCCTCVDCLR